MSEKERLAFEAENIVKGETFEDLPGVIKALGELKSGAVITEEGVSHLFNRHPTSVKRAIDRGELPPPVRMFGSKVWTVGVLVSHIETRLSNRAKELEQEIRKIATLRP